MPTILELEQALISADAAGDVESARVLAAEMQRAMGGSVPAPSQAPQPPASPPQQEDTYLSRSVDGIKRMAGSVIGDNPGQDAITGLKAMAQGVPFVGTKTDNLYAAVRSAITGEDEKKLQQEYMAPVEQMNPYARGALQMGGGAAAAVLPGVGPVVSSLATKPAWLTPLISAVESVVSGPGRRDSGKPFVNDVVENAPADAVVGATGGVAGLVAATLLGRAVPAGMNMLRSAQGKPTDPFTGRAGAAAQERVKAAVEANPADPAKPLLSQPAGASLGKEVAAYGGPTAAEVVGAAKAAMRDNSLTREAGKAFQGLGIVPVGLRTTPTEVAASPRISSNSISSALGNPDLRKIVAGVEKDVRFDGIPRDNLTLLHEVNIQLGKAAKGLRKDTPVKAERMDALRAYFTDLMDGVVPGYKDALGEYKIAARETAAAQEMAKAAGGNAKFVKSESQVRIPNMGESVSGSIPGAATRAAFNYGSVLAEAIGLTHTKEANKIIARLLVEKDPAQIAMILRSAKKQHGGKPFRPGTVFQGNNALSPWRNEEAR